MRVFRCAVEHPSPGSRGALKRRSCRVLFTVLCFIVPGGWLPAVFANQGRTADRIWKYMDAELPGPLVDRAIVPERYAVVRLDGKALHALLSQAPMEFARAENGRPRPKILLPMPDGRRATFTFEESPIMEPALAARFPEIRTYRGQGVDDPDATTRFGWTSAGFHAIVFSPGGTVYIDPYRRNDTIHYITYFERDCEAEDTQFRCLVKESGDPRGESNRFSTAFPSGSILRTYRLALAADGEYTQFHGGTADSALNQGIIPTMNRVNGIYEREVAVHMNLVDKEMGIIYTDPSGDPYTNGDVFQMLYENQANLDAAIGTTYYDIGHVFGTSGGGVAGHAVVCLDGGKAWGVTGTSYPTGDPFDVDYVAHEMGHQFSAYHSFNGTTSYCGGSRVAGSAYEPGSGSTIMGYAGVCGAENLQSHSDDYFHVKSLDEIITFTTSGGGNACAVQIETGNHPPTVDAGADYTIPRSTPFVLAAQGRDTDEDPVTYCWEEYDLGAAAPPNTDNGDRPIFRSFDPDPLNSPSRTFPRLEDILANSLTFGEAWPMTDRTMTFRVTARDNRATGGGVDTDWVHVAVATAAGPFTVHSPKSDAVWVPGSLHDVQWEVAGTADEPISEENVRISLSTDGGYTFPHVLADGTANDGSEWIKVPVVTSSAARLKVEAWENVFFDISDFDFGIAGSPCPAIDLSPATLPEARVGVAYSQVLTASGGEPPYTFSVAGGLLPEGLGFSADGLLSGTPSVSGPFDFTVLVLDAQSCGTLRDYTMFVAAPCLFCDEFSDSALDPSWTYTWRKGEWYEDGQRLIGQSSAKVSAVAEPVFAGCSLCTVETYVSTDGGVGSKVAVLGWRQSDSNEVELILKPEAGKCVLRQRAGGLVVARARAAVAIPPGETRHLSIGFDGTAFTVAIDGAVVISMPAAAGTLPEGTVGFMVRRTTGAFESISVN